MSARPPAQPYARIAWINAWLDERNAGLSQEADDVMRVLKLAEECGEVASAYIGMTGQNPRKGITHTRRQMLDELADVAVTAMCAIQHFTGNAFVTEQIMDDKVNAIMHRVSLSPPSTPESGA
jgi:NTP pyrophosphatase (non-canonical NTP hydrolase)